MSFILNSDLIFAIAIIANFIIGLIKNGWKAQMIMEGITCIIIFIIKFSTTTSKVE